MSPGTSVAGEDGRLRCPWGLSTPDYVSYHDDEWGRPIRTDNGLYERLTLEGFQSGLSWLTILRKRQNFRTAFADFDIATVATFDDEDRARLLADAGIVRHGGKIDAALAKELKRRGFRFVGPTTAYALMQAAGLVNDHLADCWARDRVRR